MTEFPEIKVNIAYHRDKDDTAISGPLDSLHALHLIQQGILQVLSKMEPEEYAPRVRLFNKLPLILNVQIIATFLGQRQAKIQIKGGDLSNLQKSIVLTRGSIKLLTLMAEARHEARQAAENQEFPFPDTNPDINPPGDPRK